MIADYVFYTCVHFHVNLKQFKGNNVFNKTSEFAYLINTNDKQHQPQNTAMGHTAYNIICIR